MAAQPELSRGGCIVMAAVLAAWTLLAGGAVVGAIAFASWAIGEQSRAVAPALDLGTFSGTAPASPRVVLQGWLHDRLAARYESFVSSPGPGRREWHYVRSDHTFTPVTSMHWKPGEPVSIVLEDTANEKRDDESLVFGRSIRWKLGGDPSSVQAWRTGDSGSAPAGQTFNVRLRKNDLPSFVEDAYERAGMRLTHPYWVADQGADPTTFILALSVSVLVSIFAMTFAMTRLLGWLRRRPRRALA